MKLRLDGRIVYRGVLVLFVSVFLLSGCRTMEPVLDVGAALGVSTGVVTSGQAESIRRSAVAVGKTLEDITPEQEYYMGRAVAATILGRYRPYPDEEANRYVNLVGQTLAQASDRPETFGGYHFLILDADEINAFAAPGGFILVTRGMLRLCQNEDQVAAVLAHEIAHIQGRDGLRSIRSGRLTSALTILAAEGMKNLGSGELAQVTEAFEGSVSDITATLLNNGYSRDLEREADRCALMFLGRVGYDPGALTTVLKQMESRTQKSGSGFGRTHPDPIERIMDLGGKPAGVSQPAVPAARQARFEQALGNV